MACDAALLRGSEWTGLTYPRAPTAGEVRRWTEAYCASDYNERCILNGVDQCGPYEGDEPESPAPGLRAAEKETDS